MKTLSTASDMLLSLTAVLNSFRRATCRVQLTDRAKRETAVAIFLETKSDLTKAIWRVFLLMSDMASSLNTTPSGSKGATPSSSSLNRLSTASNEGEISKKAEGSKLRNANPSQYVKLNVGGSLHYTTIGTLTKVGWCLIMVVFWNKGPSLYYVRVFWSFLEQPTTLRKNTLSKEEIEKICRNLTSNMYIHSINMYVLLVGTFRWQGICAFLCC